MTPDSFVGRLADGKRVYVRRLKGDRSGARIAFAVFADTERDGKMRLVARYHDPPVGDHRVASRQMYCANGWEHGRGECCWTRVPEQISPREAARWGAHWWSHVVDKRSEVVELTPVRRPVDEQTRHDVAASVVRHADLAVDNVTRSRDALDPIKKERVEHEEDHQVAAAGPRDHQAPPRR